MVGFEVKLGALAHFTKLGVGMQRLKKRPTSL